MNEYTEIGQGAAESFDLSPSHDRGMMAPSTLLNSTDTPYLLESVWDAGADAMAISDPTGIVLAANPAYYALYGLTPEQVVGQSFAAIFPTAQQPWAIETYLQLFADPVVAPSIETTVRRNDGSARMVEARYTFLTKDGHRRAMLSLVRDITERKQSEAERERLLVTEQETRRQVEAAVRLRDQVITAVSHDLRTPLATIRGSAQLLRRWLARGDTPVPPNFAAALEQIEVATGKSVAMLEELLDTARLQTGESLALQRTPTDLGALVRESIALQQASTARHRITVEERSDSLVGYWDPIRLERVVDNLLANAIKYSPAGGTIRVRVGRAERGTAAWAVLDVEDEGIGIAAADLPHVFERWWRGGNVAGISGSGIGLAGAQQIVAQHGGIVEVVSREGQGSTFTITLPLSEPAIT